MKFLTIAFLMLLTFTAVFCQNQEKKVGEPTFHLQGGAAGKNLKNFQGGYNAGVGTKVWQKKDKSLDVGVNYGRNFARVEGRTYKSKPSFGVGMTYRWGKK